MNVDILESVCSLNLLQLPPEILLMIGRFLIVESPEEYCSTSLHRSLNFVHLFSLSRSHSLLRWMCVNLGFFRRITPKRIPAFGFDNCNLSSSKTFASGISSLGINIGNSELWDICGRIMKQFPNLDELCLSGTIESRRIEQLYHSALGDALPQFNGTTLTIRNARFDDAS